MDRIVTEKKLFLRFLKEKKTYKKYKYNFSYGNMTNACLLFKQPSKRWIECSFYWFGTIEGDNFWVSVSTSWILFLDAWYDPHTIGYRDSILNKIRRFVDKIFK